MPDREQERVIGVLPSAAALQAAIDRLELAGFDRAQFGVLAPQAAVEGWRRHPTATARDVARNPAVPTGAYIEPESEGAAAGGLIGGLTYLGAGLAAGGIILTGGSLGIALAGVAAAGGAGGLLGALLAYGFHHEHARSIHDQLEHGGLVLWIQPRTAGPRPGRAQSGRCAGGPDPDRKLTLSPTTKEPTMGYAGYGNHSELPPSPDGSQEPLPQESRPGGVAPAAIPHEPGGADPLREVEAEQARFARIEPGLTPPWHETSPHRRDGNPTVSPEATREISTPAEGAGPLPTEGNDVDPGLG